VFLASIAALMMVAATTPLPLTAAGMCGALAAAAAAVGRARVFSDITVWTG